MKFPIKTGNNDAIVQPRLLVSVDVQEGDTVTFDRYPKKDGHGKQNIDPKIQN